MRVAVLGSIVAPLLVLWSGEVSAHAFLDHADPRVGSTISAAPREVSLSFSQDLEPAFSGMEIIGPSGQRVDDGKPRIDGKVMHVPLRADRPGTYRVRWHVLSVDTHTTEGAFSFQVRQ